MIEDYLDTLSNLFIKELVCILLLLRVCVHTLQKMKIVIKINSAVWNTSEEMKNRVRNLSCPVPVCLLMMTLHKHELSNRAVDVYYYYYYQSEMDI